MEHNQNGQRFSNIHYGYSQFLDQISTKSPLNLINDLCNLNKIKPEYTLIDVQGPDHAKIFTGNFFLNTFNILIMFNSICLVYLKLGKFEKHNGQGYSIKNAKHNAARNALQNTRLKLPMHNASKWNKRKSILSGNVHKKLNFTNESNTRSLNENVQPMPKFISNQNNLVVPNFIPNYINYVYPVPIYWFTPNNLYYPACYYTTPIINKKYAFSEVANFGLINNLTKMSGYINDDKMIQSNSNERNLNQNFITSKMQNSIKSEIQTNEINDYRDNQRNSEDPLLSEEILNNLFEFLSINSDLKNKNPISLLYIIADKNELYLTFEWINLDKPVHNSMFLYECRLFDKKDNRTLFRTVGKERSKKLAKQKAAETMLIMIENKNISKLSESKLPENEKNVDNNQLNEFSNKFVSLVYNLAQNMNLREPFFQYLQLETNNVISKQFAESLNLPPSEIHCVECTLFFNISINKIIQFKSIGYSITKRMAKQIASFIILLNMGIDLLHLDKMDTIFNQSLQFSFKHNSIISNDLVEKVNNFNQTLNLSIFNENEHKQNLNLTENSQFKVNCDFVLFIMKKFYFYNLKCSSSKHVKIINEKIQYLIKNFQNHSNYQIDHFDEKTIQEIISNLNLEKYWSHLQLITKLLVMGTGIDSKSLLQFHCQFFSNSNLGVISFISIRLNNDLNKTIFHLIDRKYINCSYGTNEDEARESGSLMLLNKLASNSYNYFVNDWPKNNDKNLNTEENIESNSLKVFHSKKSKNQIKCSQILSLLFQACKDLFVRKPEYSIENKCNINGLVLNSQLDTTDLIYCRLDLYFKQDLNSTKLSIISLSNNKRLCRTIAAYIFLMAINFPISMSMKDIFNIPYFEKYLKYSIEQNASINVDLISKFTNVLYDKILLKEIHENIQLIQFIFQEIYQSYLKNQKRTDPSCLVPKIMEKLFEYFNHKKQIMDQSDTFDRWSHHIQSWIDNIISKFDSTKYWDHLQLLSLIGSTISNNINKPLNPPAFEFHCKLIETDLESFKSDPSNKLHSKGFIAIITVHCSSLQLLEDPNQQDNCRTFLANKQLLSYALDQNEIEAREMASYRALRYLAINIWKNQN